MSNIPIAGCVCSIATDDVPESAQFPPSEFTPNLEEVTVKTPSLRSYKILETEWEGGKRGVPWCSTMEFSVRDSRRFVLLRSNHHQILINLNNGMLVGLDLLIPPILIKVRKIGAFTPLNFSPMSLNKF